MGTAAFGVDDSLGNAFSIEVGQKINQMEILQEQWAVAAHPLGLIWMRHRDAIAGGVECILRGGVAIVLVSPELATRAIQRLCSC